MLLRSRRFTVHDLGVDVAPDEVARAVADLRPDVVGLSGLLTTSFPNMRDTASAVREVAAGLGIRLPVIVGGGQVTAERAAWVGADGWSINAATGVQAIADLVAEARRPG
jgi:methanogenic corrinoid protein MtbC1